MITRAVCVNCVYKVSNSQLKHAVGFSPPPPSTTPPQIFSFFSLILIPANHFLWTKQSHSRGTHEVKELPAPWPEQFCPSSLRTTPPLHRHKLKVFRKCQSVLSSDLKLRVHQGGVFKELCQEGPQKCACGLVERDVYVQLRENFLY